MTERKSYIYQFSFLNENDDIVCHEEQRDVTDEFNAASYALDWLAKFQIKYGYCFHVIVYEEDNPLNILVNVERDF